MMFSRCLSLLVEYHSNAHSNKNTKLEYQCSNTGTSRRGFLNRLRLRRNNTRLVENRPFSERGSRNTLDCDENSNTTPTPTSNTRYVISKWITGDEVTSNRVPLYSPKMRRRRNDTEVLDQASLLKSDVSSDDWIVDWNDLDLKSKAGEGTSGEVWKGTYRDQIVAVKISRGMYSSDDTLSELSAEASALFALKAHPHVVKLYVVFEREARKISILSLALVVTRIPLRENTLTHHNTAKSLKRSKLGTVLPYQRQRRRVGIVLEWCNNNVKELLREHPISMATRTGVTLFMKIAKST